MSQVMYRLGLGWPRPPSPLRTRTHRDFRDREGIGLLIGFHEDEGEGAEPAMATGVHYVFL